MRKLLPVLAAMLLGATAQAQDRMLAGERLAAACANCHGTNGRVAAEGGDSAVLKSLAGRPAAQLRARMQAFRDGSASATVMQQIAKGFTGEEVALMADFFAAQKEGR